MKGKGKVVLVELNCEKMIEEGRKQGFFTYVSTPTDIKRNNAVAQNKARTFYSTHTVSSSMRFHGENSSNVGLVTEINNEHYLVPANCKFFCYDVKDIEEKIDMLTAPYDFVLLDPPWWNKYIRRKKAKCVNAGYQMMYDFELIKIPIASLTAAGSLVAVWCTNSENHLNFLLNEIFPAWDVEYIGNWFWLKVTHGGEPVCQFSEPPGKQPFEQIVFGHRKDANREQPLPEPNKVIISIPSAIHSHKPPIADVMAQYLPQKPRCIELFARYLLPGWTSWGYEVMKLQHLSLFIERDEKTELVECCNVIST
ncbi:N(6)-adenine-specific methyltransferase METTL4 isoform X2 [Periplaneta americana]|uniref:N(6)-adenine-specific methyltransferase METTL4 isoform X2 n=1 Tax=Periplaneta americana TaxID=6978 RepID=UPI0037E8B6D5